MNFSLDVGLSPSLFPQQLAYPAQIHLASIFLTLCASCIKYYNWPVSVFSLSRSLSLSLALSLSRSLARVLSHSLTTLYTRALFQMLTQTHTKHSHITHKTHTQIRNTHTSMMHAHACRFYVEQLW